MNLTWKSGVLLAVSLVAASAIGCALALSFLGGEKKIPLHSRIHEVLQEDLGLSAEQTQTLQELEDRFLEREAKLKAANAAAVSQLADVLERDQTYSPAVEEAIAEIHRTQAALHQATIEHILETEQVLDPDQYQKFLHLVSDALRGGPETSSH